MTSNANNNEKQPKEYDLVLGNQQQPQSGDLVLGGIAGVKKRLRSQSLNEKIAVIEQLEKYGVEGFDILIDIGKKEDDIQIKKLVFKEIIKYGDRGVNFVIEHLFHSSLWIQKAAIEILIDCPQEKAKLALRGNTNSVSLYIKRGTERLNKKDYQGAIDDFSEVLDYIFEYTDLYNRRAFCYQQLQQYQLAINDLSRIITIASNSNSLHGVYYNRGNCYLSLKEYKKAIAD
ncbi:hypothetical protein H1P_3260006 [Hyella patelloides LEGE 07179]|uniref:Uncharacterized protein n=1 Tax=Hyella patelloides LEGE 07179 TaxID=945734 RepID=A0A563VV41_9CYAN|nr:tetratricopeptide repeat protein [Hyella patelloides]VEP15328.1 hypothetical protein H1P_3260006 [Hyella patelloides LEGE 07179]